MDASEVGGRDFPRTLSDEGHTRSLANGKAFARMGLAPDEIWTSDYPRARETAEITAACLPGPPQVKVFETLGCGLAPESALALFAREAPQGELMIVGHNPDFERLVAFFIAAPYGSIRLKKGACATLELTDPLTEGCGHLVALWTAGKLARLA